MKMLLNGMDETVANKISTIENLVKSQGNDISGMKNNISSIKNTTNAISIDSINKINSIDDKVQKLTAMETVVKEIPGQFKTLIDNLEKICNEAIIPEVNKIKLIDEKVQRLNALEGTIKSIPEQFKSLTDNLGRIEKSTSEKIIPEINKIITSFKTLTEEIKNAYALKIDLEKKQNTQILARKEITSNDSSVQLKHSLSKKYGLNLSLNIQCFGGINHQRSIKDYDNKDILEIASNECGKFQIYSSDNDNVEIKYFDFPISRSKIDVTLSGFKDGVLDVYFQPKE